MKRLQYIAHLLIVLLFTVVSTAYGQNYFRVIEGIPHLPVIDPSTVSSPELGMLIFSSTDSKPMIYTGAGWETLCTNSISTSTPQDFFVVKNGIPYLPSLSDAPLNPLAGSIYYSTLSKAVMVYNGTTWSKMAELTTSGSLSDNSGFVSGKNVSTYKLPVINSNPAVTGLTAGAIYVNSLAKAIRYYDGSSWKDIACYPIVVTSPVTKNTTGYTATSGGDVISNGGSNVTLTGICWSPVEDPDTTLTSKTRQVATGTGVGSFISDMTDLLPVTTYYVRAYAVNSQGISYGDNVKFTTPVALPTIITLDADSITCMRAISGGDITFDGGSPVTKRGIIWSALGDPLNDTSNIRTDDGSGVGKFPSTLMNLLGNTTYYVRAYAVNVAGTAYGNLIQFTTPPPILAAMSNDVKVTNITGTTALATATVLNNGGAIVTEKGVCISTDKATYTCLPSSTVTTTDVGTYTVDLTGLTEGTTYYIKAYATNSVGTAYSSETSFTTAALPHITTTAPSNVAGTTALSGGNILDVGYSVITTRGICWDTLPSPTLDVSTKTVEPFSGNGTGTFSSVMTGLEAGRTYYVRAYVINAAGTAYGQQEQITMPDSAKVVTLAASSLFNTTATVGGNVLSDGGAAVTERGVCWSLSPNPTVGGSHTSDGTGLGIFTSILTNLAERNVYHYRAYATNIIGVSYGEDRTFTIVPEAPVIVTLVPNTITSISAMSGGEITNNGGAPITKRGILWSSVGDPVDDINATITDDGSGVGLFPSSLTMLLGNTTYYVRAYAINAYGKAYGNLLQFTTPPPVLAELNPPTISDVTDTTAVGTFLILNNGGAPITSRGLCYSTDRTSYTYVPSATVNKYDIGTFIVKLMALSPSTTYFVKAYAINSVGTAYSSETSFKTTSLPLIVTTPPHDIQGYDAYSGGTVSYVGDATLKARGICWSADTIPTIDLTTKTSEGISGSGTGTFTSHMTGLKSYTKYYVRAYAINSYGVGYGNLDSLTTATTATLITTKPSAITATTAVTGGYISDNGNSEVTSRGVCWSTTPNPTLNNSYTTDGSGNGAFISNLKDLTGSTKYYVRAYAINEVGVSYGNLDSLKTAPPVVPTVSTTDVINIGSNTAVGRGYVSNAGGATVTERGVCWNTTGSPTIDDSHAAGGSGLGNFAAGLTGLTPVTKYYMRAYAINDVGIAYGDVITFLTFTVATIQTSDISEITSTTAKGGGTIISDGGTPVTSSGICWNTTGNPTTDDAHTTSGIGIGNFIHSLSNLMGSTTYYVRAYAINNAGTAYGQVVSFTTTPPILATVTTTPGSYWGDGRHATAGGTIVSNGGGVISTEGLVWSKVSGFNPDTVVINRSTQTGSGNFSSVMSNLTPGTTYYVRAYVINSVGTSYASNEVTVSTYDYPTVITTPPDVSTITSVSVQAGGNVTSNGGTAVTESGICWSVDTPPTIANDHISNGPGIGSFTRTINNLMGSTIYYVRAYAINSVGIAYGSVESFTTKPPVLATIVTTTPTATSSTTGIGGGNILSNGGAVVTTRGICWSTVSGFNPDTVVVNKTAATGYYTGLFTAPINGLTPKTVYYVRAYVENSVGRSYGDEMSFTTPTLPTITTAYASANGPTKGTTGGNITDDGGADITTRGVVWSKTLDFNPDTVQVNKTYDGSGAGSFVTHLSGLKGNTTYYVVAYATNLAGTSYGNQLSFITDPATLATVTTRDAWNISGKYVYSGGYISDDGGEPVTTRGMLWSTKSGFRPDTVVVNKTFMTGSGNGNYTTVISGLQMGTTYYARAYVVNSIGIAYGNEISFTTLNIPTLTTMAVSPSSSGYSAAGGGTLVSDGGAAVTNEGVCWSTNHNPTVGLYTKTTYDPWAGNNFYSALDKLQPVTTYYVRAYAVNSQGIAYGDEVSFTTPVALPIITTNVVTPTSKSTAATGGKISSDGGGTITAKGVIWSTNPAFNPDTVVVNRTMDGTGSSNFTSIVSGLQLSTAYYIRAYATNSAGTSYGNQVTVTIFPTAPMLRTVDPTAITGYTTTSGGIITSDGGASITAKGMCWASHTNPTISDYTTSNGSGTDSWSAMLTNLQPNTLYYVRAYAINKVGVAYGEEKMILTNAVPTLSATFPATKIIATTATSGGEITDDGRSPILTRGICWSIYDNPTIALATKTVDDTTKTIGSFLANMTGLTPNTTYYVRAYATNAVGVGYGSEISFTTLPVMLPTLVTVKPYAVDSVTATSGGNIIDDGGMPVTVRGICWSTTPNPTTALTTKINNATGGIGLYTNIIAGLSPGTKYYVRAYAINSKGTAYGNLDSLKTMAVRPTVSDVVMSNLTDSSGVSNATVIYDGGDAVTDRGFCWNTTGTPTLSDHVLPLGTGIGAIKDTLYNLNPKETYYIRAYAVNGSGIGYSPTVTSFKICPSSFDVIHYEGLNGAAVSKTVTYHSISTNMSGKAACWITQNLGADHEATSVTDATEPSAGWYWQFNRVQGYQYTTARYPFSWTATFSENSDWQPANDPCSLLLGNGWRIPTYAEWNNAKGAPQNWTNGTMAFNSVLKLHNAGYLGSGTIQNRGGQGNHWTSTQYNNTDGRYTGYSASSFGISAADANSKSKYAFTLRCLRDTVFISKPSVSDVSLTNMTNSGVDLNATVTPDGGAPVTQRGFCWNTTGLPTISDSHIDLGTGIGSITTTLSNLKQGVTYYARAYAANSQGLAYSPDSIAFKICPPTFVVQHVAGLNGAPVSKSVTYHSISSTYSGAARCWITQNLGADSIATSTTDNTAKSAGWYWQFNRPQGYQYTTSRTPATTWTSITESSDWVAGNDPCALLLGGGWRIPTSTEYTNVISTIVAKGEIPYTSPLKMHYSGYLNYGDGSLAGRGVYGIFWSSTATSTTYASYYQFSSGANNIYNSYKWHGFTLRCLRDTIAITPPSVSNVTLSNMTPTTINTSAIVTPDGGAPVTARGFCWNTTGNPTLSDHVIACGDSLGTFTNMISGLVEGPTYYVRAFATNKIGTAYSVSASSFKICKPTFTVQHIAGIDGAAETKTVTYNSISSNLTGKAVCWLLQNLGADSVATSAIDATSKSAGWYWQFNRLQAYKYDAGTRTPYTTWNLINETGNWLANNDPCSRLLGSGWRMPTSTEWSTVNGAPQNWANYNDAFNSELKLHNAGFLNNTTGILAGRGTQGNYWSSNASAATTANDLQFYNAGSGIISTHDKAYGFSLRCLRDTVVISMPSVGVVTINPATMTTNTADASSAIGSDGGATVTARGFCWNTTGNPTLSDHVVSASNGGTGNFSATLTGVPEDSTYYVRAYATNSAGTAYSDGTGFNVILTRICPPSFKIQHTAGINGAPVTKSVTYTAVRSYLTGAGRCWIQQNLGADSVATAVNDATERSAGWYFQFNNGVGYKHTGSVRTPIAWIAGFNEAADWTTLNDPCRAMLGSDWRLPTSTEYSTANGAPQNWANYNDPFNSELKLHNAGYIAYNTGDLGGRGTQGNYWSSTRYNNTDGYDLQFYNAGSAVVNHIKAYGFSVRCLRDGIVKMPPTLGTVVIADSTMTDNSAQGFAPLISGGGTPVSEHGFCWNTTGNPTISDNKIVVTSTDSLFNTVITNLKQGITYYIRAYAVNKIGLSYSPTTTQFKVCPPTFSVLHDILLNGTPVTKNITYHSVNSTLSGAARCWITQNLGADNVPASVTDNSNTAAGWYWQFNRVQGYQYNNGGSLIPSSGWVATINESANWSAANDPCALLLSNGWRIPTSTEWTNAITNGGWASTNAYSSTLKLHAGGQIATGALTGRGSSGYFWSSTQAAPTTGYNLQLTGSTGFSSNIAYSKADRAASIRCLRDTLAIVPPLVSNVALVRMTDSAAVALAAVTPDGGAPITARGICWNSTGNPTIADHVITDATAKLGEFTDSIMGLQEGKTYYIRAYATNNAGVGYSPTATSFKICKPVKAIHIANLNGAPVSKNVTYGTVSTDLSGKLMCWITQNLGSDQQATSATDATEKSSGWYWQFNSSKGYKYDASTLTPAITAWNPWAVPAENNDWRPENDPCNSLLGLGWRLPTRTEWSNVISNGSWASSSPYTSPLKLHKAGYLNGGGLEGAKGSVGFYCSSTQNGSGSDFELYYSGSTASMTSNAKSNYAWSVRCVRDTIVRTVPKVGNITMGSITLTTADATAAVSADGGSPIQARGFCWSTTGTPTISDNRVIDDSLKVGVFMKTLTNLKEGPTYYIRAYATNSSGTGYSPIVTSFKICPSTFVVTHVAGLNGAPVSKTVTYHSVSSDLSGAARCWLTQNLGADSIPSKLNDATEQSSGWYWQFNSSQGYKNDGSTLTPAITAWNPWAVPVINNNWLPENDPCNLMLGLGWRLPTMTEWSNVISNGHWAYLNPFASPLRIHRAGYLNGGGLEGAKGSVGQYCSSTQNGSGSEYHLLYDGSTGSISSNAKSTYAWSVRCLRDTLVLKTPSVTNAVISTTTMTLTTADASATVGSDGGSAVKTRGFCWNTTGNPTIGDSILIIGSGLGAFNGTLKNLKEGPTYYIRAFATNNNGTGYSPIVTSFKICPSTFVVTHVAGLNGAPVSKTVTYHSVSSDLSGAARCWLTQNLGADSIPSKLNDATEQSSGWYWQFNSSQGYKNDGSTLTPAITAWNPWAVPVINNNWLPENDPCNLMLGLGWRLPTMTEWSNVISNGHWAYLNPFASPLRIHRAGYLNGGGLEGAKGAVGQYCSSTQNGSGSEYHLLYDGSTGSISSNAKSTYAWSVRCLRDTLVLTTPSVTNAVISTATMTLTTADASATVGSDGGSAVKARGFCWNTTGNPTIADNVVPVSSGLGAFNETIQNLKEGPTYYIRAFATNNNGTGYSPTVTTFKICPSTFVVTHVAGLNGAPVSKTVKYHSVSSDLSGTARCWLTQNLGADSIPSKLNDATEQSSGWYWQFNSSQGYKNDGSTLTPAITAWTPWAVPVINNNWLPENDPCNLMLGLGWRLPTSTEWSNVISNGHWAYLNPFASPLKIHMAGYLNGGGLEGAKGAVGYYCSSTQNGSGSDYELYYDGSTASIHTNAKSTYAWSVRCLRDTLVLTTPSVTNAVVSTTTMTLTTADASATVGSDGGSAVKTRGFCWNTTGNPTIGDSILIIGSGLGAFNGTLKNLKEGPTYYIRAFATNNNGTGYSPIVTSFKICPSTFVVTHVAGLNGAPVSKTVTYHSVSSDLSGAARCWLTQNLGADRQPTAISDATELSSGWYWQFNSSQGYMNDGTTLAPAITAWTPWTGVADNYNWRPERDPCNLMLGLGWRLPTSTEWSNVISNGHWAYLNPFSSPLMIHRAGYLDGGGLAGAKGSVGYYCSSTQNGSGSDYEFYLNGTTGSMTSNAKVRYAWSVRCLRDTLVLKTPSVTDALISTATMTLTTADASATVGSDGGSAVKTRGFCWNTTGNPTIGDSILIIGSGLGAFNGTLKNLKEGPTYYIRAFATNNNGTGYSPTVTSFKICPATFIITHVAGLNGVPVSKTVTYHSVSTDLSGAARCWLTQNLGADQQPTAISDATEQSSGWYWQFNSSQGYKNDGSTLTPAITAWTPWTGVADNSNWRPENDPCNLMLGLGWRLPTSTEWSNVINNGHWAYLNPYSSPLRIHRAGYLDGGGLAGAKGSVGYYCSSTQNGSGSDYEFYLNGTTGSMTSNAKVRYAWSVRCLRDTLVFATPSVTNAVISTATMTLTTADASATVGSDGGSTVKARGFCWNTTGNPTIADNVVPVSSGLGAFNETIQNLKEGPTYYIRAFATNNTGTGYSPIVTSFKICPSTFVITHVAGLNGAPVSKTVTYHSVSTDLSGAARCWLTQNLGADQQPTAISDATEQSSGWYWQFNSAQGYKYDASTLTPSITAWNPWAVPVINNNWLPENDPCNLMLGLGWRLPTMTEWSNVISNGHWAYLNPFASPLKIHRAGYLNGGGLEGAKGAVGQYCSSTQNGSGSEYHLLYDGSTGSISSNAKSTYAWSVRCLRDTLVLTTPTVSDASIPTATMTLTSADATATTVGLTAGPSVSEKGFCWNTTGNPTISDNFMSIGTGFGTYTGTIPNLVEGTTYYVRAYARNNIGVGYSTNTTSFKICPATFNVTHTAGVNGAPVSKSVTYHSVSSNFSGVPRCWLTQNLGADQQPTAISDATDQSSGWYWQFNSAQGYKYDASTLTPSLATLPWSSFTENSDWRAANDPCSLLLGTGWRLPTYSEWTNTINNGHFAYLNPFASPLMIHRAGYLDGGGLAGAKGAVGYYCSSTQNGSASDYEFYLNGATGSIVSNAKARYAWSVRCLK